MKDRVDGSDNENGRCEWKTFAEWYNEYEIYIKSGAAKNVINDTLSLQTGKLSRKNTSIILGIAAIFLH